MADHSSTTQSQTRWFSSEVDWWLAVILVALPVVAIATLVLTLLDGEGVVAAILGCVFIAGLYAIVVYPVRYGLESDNLVVRFGIFRKHIPYSRIRAVRPTTNPLSSPALSLRRLRVDYGEGPWTAVMISPSHRDTFLDELARRTGLKRSGDSLGA